MTPTSLITARWVKQNGVPTPTDIPTAAMVQAFTFGEFGQICSEPVAVRVRTALIALSQEWRSAE